MDKYFAYTRTACLVIMAASFVVISYSQYEGMKAQRIQAVTAVMAQDNFVKITTPIHSVRSISAGFSIQEVYGYLYGAEYLVKNTQDENNKP